MGCKLSRSCTPETYSASLTSYSAECQINPQIQSFDSIIQQRTARAISAVTVVARPNGPVHSLSFNSLMEITGGLLDLNREVVSVLLESKKDIWKNPELFQLVEEYFDTSIESLDFCNCLENCVKKARDSQIMIQLTIRRFEEEGGGAGEGQGQDNNFVKTLEELRRFKEAGEPFTPEFFQVLEAVRIKHLNMLDKLLQRQRKLDKKLKSIKSWRKISSVIFVAAFITVMMCSIVAAAVSAPPVLAALSAAALVPVGSMGKWLESLFKSYQNSIKSQLSVLGAMQAGTFLVIQDLDSIRVLTEGLEIQMASMLDNAEFVLRDNEALRIVMEEIKKKVGDFMKNVEELGEQADRCSSDIRMARTLVLRKIINSSSTRDYRTRY